MGQYLRQTPFTRLFACLLAGIVAARYLPGGAAPLLGALALASAPALALLYRMSGRPGPDSMWGAALHASCLALGAYLALEARPLANPPRFPDQSALALEIVADNGQSGARHRYQARIFMVGDQRPGADLGVALSLDTATGRYSAGDVVSFRGTLRAIENRGNPGEFDYRGWAARQGIYYQTSARQGDHVLLGQTEAKPLRRLGWRVARWIDSVYAARGVEGHQLAILKALTTGDKRGIDEGLRSSFATSGLMHVLAVSGLHVGIIYMILGWLAAPLLLLRRGKALRTLSVLAALWLYALFTGMSPSVTRATLMFSFLLVGESAGRRYASENALFASAFFLAISDPNIVYEVGFQLSYLAVFGIFKLYRPISSLVATGRWLPDKAWELCALSLAAQIATTPISLYYFHQFPTYFIFGNLLIVPLVGLVIEGAALMLALSALPFVPYAADAVGWGVDLMLTAMTRYAAFVETLPGSLVTGLHVGAAASAVMYLAVAAGYRALSTRRFAASLSVALSALCLAAMWLGADSQARSRDRAHAFAEYGAPPLLFVRGDEVHALLPDTIFGAQRYVDQLSAHYRRPLRLASSRVRDRGNTAWRYGGRRFLLANRLGYHDTALHRRFDYVVYTPGYMREGRGSPDATEATALRLLRRPGELGLRFRRSDAGPSLFDFALEDAALARQAAAQ